MGPPGLLELGAHEAVLLPQRGPFLLSDYYY